MSFYWEQENLTLPRQFARNLHKILISLINPSWEEMELIKKSKDIMTLDPSEGQLQEVKTLTMWDQRQWLKIRDLACRLILCWCINSLNAHSYSMQIKSRFLSLNFEQECKDTEGFSFACSTYNHMIQILESIDNSVYFLEIDRLICLLDQIFEAHWNLVQTEQLLI